MIEKLKKIDRGTFVYSLISLTVVSGVISPLIEGKSITLEGILVSFLIAIPLAYIASFVVFFISKINMDE